MKGHRRAVLQIQWDPSRTKLASCSRDKTIKIWDLNNDSPLHSLEDHTYWVKPIKWSPAGPGSDNPSAKIVLASCSWDGTVGLWDVDIGRCLNILSQHEE